jgi:hypothetical protein
MMPSTVHDDPRFQEMVQTIPRQADEDGLEDIKLWMNVVIQDVPQVIQYG